MSDTIVDQPTDGGDEADWGGDSGGASSGGGTFWAGDVAAQQVDELLRQMQFAMQRERLRYNAAYQTRRRELKQAHESMVLERKRIEGEKESARANAERRISQIGASRDTFLSQVKDTTVLELNRQISANKYAVGRAVASERLTAGQATASAAASGLRLSGTPLLALKQVEQFAREDTQQAEAQASGATASLLMSAGQKVETANLQAEQGIQDTQVARADTLRQLNASLKSTVLQTRQSEADIRAETGLLMSEYKANIGETFRQYRNLRQNRQQIIDAAVAGQIGDFFQTAAGVLDIIL